MSESKRPAPPQVAGPAEVAPKTPFAADCTGTTDTPGRQLRRRRAASRRCERLADGRRDPLEPLPAAPPTLAELDAWAAAIAHLRMCGLVGLPPAEVRRALAAHADGPLLPRRRSA